MSPKRGQYFFNPLTTNLKMKRVIRYKQSEEAAYYSPMDLARKLNVSESTIYLMIKDGRVNAINLSDKHRRPLYRIAPSEVEKILERKAFQ
jgi:excisionase family DNA binding protein